MEQRARPAQGLVLVQGLAKVGGRVAGQAGGRVDLQVGGRVDLQVGGRVGGQAQWQRARPRPAAALTFAVTLLTLTGCAVWTDARRP